MAYLGSTLIVFSNCNTSSFYLKKLCSCYKGIFLVIEDIMIVDGYLLEVFSAWEWPPLFYATDPLSFLEPMYLSGSVQVPFCC